MRKWHLAFYGGLGVRLVARCSILNAQSQEVTVFIQMAYSKPASSSNAYSVCLFHNYSTCQIYMYNLQNDPLPRTEGFIL